MASTCRSSGRIPGTKTAPLDAYRLYNYNGRVAGREALVWSKERPGGRQSRRGARAGHARQQQNGNIRADADTGRADADVKPVFRATAREVVPRGGDGPLDLVPVRKCVRLFQRPTYSYRLSQPALARIYSNERPCFTFHIVLQILHSIMGIFLFPRILPSLVLFSRLSSSSSDPCVVGIVAESHPLPSGFSAFSIAFRAHVSSASFAPFI